MLLFRVDVGKHVHVGVLECCIGVSDMQRQREGVRSLHQDARRQSPAQNVSDDTVRACDADDAGNIAAAAAAAAAAELAEDRDDDNEEEEEDLSYDEQDSVGERSAKY